MKFFKLLTPVISAAVVLSSSVFGSILGPTFINGYDVLIGENTYFCHNTYLSNQSGVGLQNENYVIYSPNQGINPVVSYGNAIYGPMDKTLDAGSKLVSEGKDIIAGINADYFSFQTGVPMSNLIINGEVISKDDSSTPGFGIDENGKGFVAENYITATLTRADGRTADIGCINKYRQPYLAYLMNGKFSDQTHNNTQGLDIIIEAETDELRIGKTIRGTVTYAVSYGGSIKIPEGALVLTIDHNAPVFYQFSDIAEGETVEITVEAPSDPRWETAVMGMGSTGEYILSNGAVTPNLPAGAHPRTAIGLTEDGNIVLYTIDGRQTGYSYGVKLSTLAERMKEIGCIEAINLDGGGSTTMVGRLPGENKLTLLNKPSEGSQRLVSTSIFLENTLPKTGELGHLQIYPLGASYIMKGASDKLTVKAMDTGYRPMTAPEDIIFSVEDGKSSLITNDGVFTAQDGGSVFVTASYNGVTATHEYYCVESPLEIQVKNPNGANITNLNIMQNTSIDLSAIPGYGYHNLISEDSCFNWQVSGGIGTIDQNGVFTAVNSPDVHGTITVSAGNASRNINVHVLSDGSTPENVAPTFIDVPETHWAYKEISDFSQKGIILGYGNGYFGVNDSTTYEHISLLLDRLLEYKAENNEKKPALREDIIVSIVKALKIDVSNIDESIIELNFSDCGEIKKENRKYIAAAIQNELIKGYDGNLSPKDNLTRAETATLLYRATNR